MTSSYWIEKNKTKGCEVMPRSTIYIYMYVQKSKADDEILFEFPEKMNKKICGSMAMNHK